MTSLFNNFEKKKNHLGFDASISEGRYFKVRIFGTYISIRSIGNKVTGHSLTKLFTDYHSLTYKKI